MLDNNLSLVIAELMPPEAANFSGKVHGGYLLHKLDQVAYACATRYASNNTVTLSVDQVFFREPIHVGELVSFYASVNRVGKTSMEIGIKVVAEDLQTHKIRHTNTCYFTMVAVDEKGKPTPVTPFTPHTDIQKRRWQEAEHRQQVRIKLAESIKEKRTKS